MPNRDLIRASEIADWCFCRRSWHLSIRGIGPSLVQVEKGTPALTIIISTLAVWIKPGA